jgi:hypothetical protein
MALVLVSAVVLAAVAARQRDLDRRRGALIAAKADLSGSLALEYHWHARLLLAEVEHEPLPTRREALARKAAYARATASWYAGRAARYRLAALHPWEPLPPDPPFPAEAPEPDRDDPRPDDVAARQEGH